jgi:hypothetical protein
MRAARGTACQAGGEGGGMDAWVEALAQGRSRRDARAGTLAQGRLHGDVRTGDLVAGGRSETGVQRSACSPAGTAGASRHVRSSR